MTDKRSPQVESGGQDGETPLARSQASVHSTTNSKNAQTTRAGRNTIAGPAAVKLPLCAPGELSTRNGTPCEPRRGEKGGGRLGLGGRRRAGFRVPLKKEDGNLQAQVVEYNCEFPNRVVVRLEYLMQTTKVRLNDRHYMDDFYKKLIEEEQRVSLRATRLRERAETNRMKKLIIEQVEKDIPKELEYLNSHPVFRVNQMLGRLSTFDVGLALNTGEILEEVTPVEPYEYNGNKFFTHLHGTGEIWMPPEVDSYENGKYDRKVYRAKLRLMQKRREQEAEAKILRILNESKQMERQDSSNKGGTVKNSNNEDDKDEDDEDDTPVSVTPKSRSTLKRKPDWWIDIENEANNDANEDKELNEALKMNVRSARPFSIADAAVEKVKSSLQKEIARIQRKISRSKEHEKDENSKLEAVRQEQEANYLDTFDYDRERIMKRYEEKERLGNVDDIIEGADARKTLHKSTTSSVGSGRKSSRPKSTASVGEEKSSRPKSAYSIGEKKSSQPRSTSGLQTHLDQDLNDEELFGKLKKYYQVKPYPFHHLAKFPNAEILGSVEKARRGVEIYKAGNNVADMYTRELMTVDEQEEKRRSAWREKMKLRKQTLAEKKVPSLVSVYEKSKSLASSEITGVSGEEASASKKQSPVSRKESIASVSDDGSYDFMYDEE